MVFVAVLAGLLVWWPSPYYPDELAFRIGSARYIQDGFQKWGLYPFCSDIPQTLPWLFVPSAWILSLIDMTLPVFQFRAIPILAVVFAACATGAIAYRRRLLLPLSFLPLLVIGIAGSGLVLSRGEHVLIFQIGVCIAAVYLTERTSTFNKCLIGFCAVFLSITTVALHPQGALFIPLSGLALCCLVPCSAHRIKYCVAVLVICVIFFIYALSYQQFSCVNYPRLNQLFSDMVFSLEKVKKAGIIPLIHLKTSKYFEAFIYKTQYQGMYLPGIQSSLKFDILNFAIGCVLVGLTIINLVFPIYYAINVIINLRNPAYLFRQAQHYLLPTVLSAISFLLIVYDFNQFFYRTFFIHFLLVIATVIYLSQINLDGMIRKYYVWSAFLLLSLVSTEFNYKHFYHALRSWDSIASTPKGAWSQPDGEGIDKAVQQCGINLPAGHLIIDSYTYQYQPVYTSHHLLDIFYAHYAGSLSADDVPTVAAKLGIHQVLASCKIMEQTKIGWPADFSTNNICCTTFRNSKLAE